MLRIGREKVCYELSSRLKPVAFVKPGETVVLETDDSRTGRLKRPEDVITSVPEPRNGNPMVNPATGPLYIRGAEPGDALTVDILDIKLGSQGYLLAKKGVGLLGDTVRETTAWIIPVTEGQARFSHQISLPVRPMIGVIGTAPAGVPVPTMYVGDTGGNMDNPRITTGTRVFLPVQVPGALLVLGDVHGMMGDGELNGTALEMPAEVVIRIGLIKGQEMALPYLETADLMITTGYGSNFFDAARQAVREMAVRLIDAHNLNWEEAGMLLSAAGNLRICQSFGGPEVTVRLEFPKIQTTGE
jgi:amidase